MQAAKHRTSSGGVASFPPQFDPPVYRALWPDLAHMDDALLRTHFELYGEAEGRRANTLEDRGSFVALIPADAAALEIGPFCNPLLRGPRVKFFDVLDRGALEARARRIGMANSVAPHIDYVSPSGDLSVVDQAFEYVVSSHCVEHQPDLIAHLQQVGRILEADGRYMLLVPDKRYCFDNLLAETTVAGVVEAHHARRTVHTLHSVIEHRALTTHNDAMRHWAGDHGEAESGAGRLMAAIDEHNAASGTYIDVHAWYFTPKSLCRLISLLQEAGYINLVVERAYATRTNSNEFWVILRKTNSNSLQTPVRL